MRLAQRTSCFALPDPRWPSAQWGVSCSFLLSLCRWVFCFTATLYCSAWWAPPQVASSESVLLLRHTACECDLCILSASRGHCPVGSLSRIRRSYTTRSFACGGAGRATRSLLFLIAGEIQTTFVEDVLFRRTIANALNRHDAFVCVVLGAIMFGLPHGVSVILPSTMRVGVLSASVLRAT